MTPSARQPPPIPGTWPRVPPPAGSTLAHNSRHTWFVGNYVITYDVSTRVTSDMPVVAERAEYFDYVNTQGYHWQGGHDSIGVPNILGW